MIDLDRWTAVAPVLDDALTLDGPDRTAFVDAIADAGVRAEVRRFLVHDDAPATATLAGLFAPTALVDLPAGTRLGAYRIEAPIGAGGGGAVYRATDVAAGKAVAVKVLAASDRDAARVDREIRALSRMDHAGVVRYLATGTAGPDDADGPDAPTRFLAMELVDGPDLVTAADRDRLGVPERVRLLAETAHAVQLALGRAVLHRDLKPSNVLTATGEDGRLHPKVLDYGIGALLDEDADERTAIRFTPGFAAPEQVAGDLATAATDVYGLGALGAALFTGAPPEAGLAALGALPRDLCAVLTRALADDPADRYENAGAFEDDLRRFLAHEPVAARARTAPYVGGLFARRHARALAVAALVLLAAGVAAVQVVQARRATQHEARRAGEVAALLSGAFDAADPFSDEGAETNIRDLLARIERGVADRPVSARVGWEVEMLLGTAYWGAGAYEDAAEHQQEALQLAQVAYGPEDRRAAEVLRRLGETRRSQGRYAEADSLLRRASTLSRNAGDADGEHRAVFALGETLGEWGRRAEGTRALRLAARLCDAARGGLACLAPRDALVEVLVSEADSLGLADSLATRVTAAYQAAYGPDHPRTISARSHQAMILNRQGRYDAAQAAQRGIIASVDRTLGPGHPMHAEATGALAAMLAEVGKDDEAEAMLRDEVAYQRTRGPDARVALARALDNYASTRGRMADGGTDWAGSIPLFREALAIAEERMAPGSPLLGSITNNLAVFLMRDGQIDAAEPYFQRSLAMRRASVGTAHPDYAWALMTYAQQLSYRDRRPEAERTIIRATRIMQAALGPEHPNVGMAMITHGTLLVRWDRREEGMVIGREGVRIRALSGAVLGTAAR